MGLNPSKGNMYDFVTHTWNTIKGECPHGCSYCYMKRFGKQKPVRFDAKELETDLGEGNFVFVGSSCDMFASSIPAGWVDVTLAHCRKFCNKYLFQSKNPEAMANVALPRNSIVCTTIETNRFYDKIMHKAPMPSQRAFYLGEYFKDFRRFVTIEPIMDFDLKPMVELIKRCDPEQVNIGADSGNNGLPEPSLEKIMELVEELGRFTIVAKKRNLSRLEKV